MKPEDFLCKQFSIAINKDKKLKEQTTRFKMLAEIHMLRIWRTTNHRADDAIKEGLKLAKLNCAKNKGQRGLI